MVRKLDVLDIPSTIKYLESLFVKGPIKGFKFDKDWALNNLYGIMQAKNAIVLISGDPIDGFLVGAVNRNFFSGEPIGEVSFYWGNPELVEAFAKWAKGVHRVFCAAFPKQKKEMEGFKKLCSIYVRGEKWDGAN
jgi:hypothetical protein